MCVNTYKICKRPPSELGNGNKFGKVSVIKLCVVFIYLFYSLNRCIFRCRFQIYNRFSAVTCSFRVMKV